MACTKSTTNVEREQALPNYAHCRAPPPALRLYQTEEEMELQDALSPAYDQLSLAWFWWILEVLPLRQRYRREEDNAWVTNFRWNLGKGRVIPKQEKVGGVRVHRSVKMRIEALDEHGRGYKPMAGLDLDRTTWVD
jgi:hypothetical protein